MPQPKRVQTSPNEGRLMLAVSAFQQRQFHSIRSTAAAYKVSNTTLARRIYGGQRREDYRPTNHRLNTIEEEVIIKTVLQLDNQGLSPTVAIVKEMADSICSARGAPPVGIRWPSMFISRTPQLKTKYGRAYESQRRLCEDPRVIEGWFHLVRNTINKHGIQPQDIYNFDETGFQMGQISASMVVTDADKPGRPKQVKPTNTQWVTLIQGACADGSTIPPFIVFKAKQINQAWFYNNLPTTWAFTVSLNGWTTDLIACQWIQHFDKHTKQKSIGAKRLLILDNHGSHTTTEFRTYCQNNDIILLWMPPHSSHMLQPLDVGCFGPLKAAYSKQNQALIRNSVFHVTKEDFIHSFHQAFVASFTQANVQAGFRGSGLWPLDPETVLANLDPIVTSSPPHSLSEESWCQRTPHNTNEVDKQATLIKQRLERHQSSSPTPIIEALNQLSKGAQIMATQAALLQTQIATLQQANQALQINRRQPRKAMKATRAVEVGEVLAIAVQNQMEAEIREVMPRLPRKQPTCSKCKQQGHNIRNCRTLE